MDTEFFKELDKFSLLVKKRVSTAYSGGRKSLRLGHGVTPVGYREYRKGDDFKLVDWKVYGRLEKIFIKEHEEERSLVVHILLDASASMGYDGKFRYAARLAAGFAYLAAMENEKYAISFFCKRLYPGEPKRGRRHLFESIEALDEIVPKGGTNPRQMADQFESHCRTVSLVVLVSDFLADKEDVLSSIYRLSKHDLVVIQVLAPDERELKMKGDIKFVDMESKRSLVARVTDEERKEYKRRLEKHNAEISSACARSGADYFLLLANEPIFEAFSQMLSRALVWKV